MEFNIGERVRIKAYDEMPEEGRNKRMGMLAGLEGKIVDKMYSEAKGCTVYKIHLDDFDRPSKCDFSEGLLEFIEGKAEYAYEFEYLENLVVARLYEIVDGDLKKEIAKGHGHIFHDDAYGVAQAASYALKRICDKLNGGSLRSYKNN